MKQVSWGASGLKVPAVTLGCMRLEALSAAEAAAHIENARGKLFDKVTVVRNGYYRAVESKQCFLQCLA